MTVTGTRDRWRNAFRIILAVLLASWAGLILGVDFVATPAKFLTPSLALPVALDVGRYTFRVLAQVELGFVLLVFVASIGAGPSRTVTAVLAAVLIEVCVGRWWLLPELDSRAGLIMAGKTVPASAHHLGFAILEGTKCLLLLAASIRSMRDSPVPYADKHGLT